MSTNSKILGRDLRLVETEFGPDLAVGTDGDIQTISNEANLGQAIVHRFRTRRGELLDIGRSSYGSRLYDFVGEPNNERTREMLKIATRECLSREPRIKKIVSLDVRNRIKDPARNSVDIEITVIPIESEVPLNIVFPFYLEVI